MATPASGSNSLTIGGTTVPTFVPALVTAALTVIFMFMPWVHVPIANTANAAGALIGQGVAIASDYTILGMSDLVAMVPVDDYSREGIAAVRGYIFFWGASIAVLIAGVVLYITGRKWLLIVGCVMTAAVAAIWCGVMVYVQDLIAKEANGIQVFSLPPWPIATILASIATLVLAVTLKPSNAASSAFAGPTRSMPASTPSRTPVTSGGSRTIPQAPVVPPVTVSNPSTPPATSAYIDTSCFCPNCGAKVQITVPASHCMINITCGGCGEKFPMEVRPRS